MKIILLIIATVLFTNCSIIGVQKESLIGETNVERKFDEEGELIYYKKVNVRKVGYKHRPHMTRITRTKTKVFKDHKIVESYFQKTTPNFFDTRILKSKRIVWDENRKKTVTRAPKN